MQENDLFEGNYSRTFLCPYEEQCRHVRYNRPLNCMFRHIYGENEEKVPLPNFVCYKYLTTKNCLENFRIGASPDKREKYGAGKSEAENVDADGSTSLNLSKCLNEECRFGIHVTLEELQAGFESNPDNKERIEAYRAQFPDDEYQCIICLDNVRLDRRIPSMMSFCMLDNCSHIHCARCMRRNIRRCKRLRTKVYCAYRCGPTRDVWYYYYEARSIQSRRNAA